jgi:hypothetical protein
MLCYPSANIDELKVKDDNKGYPSHILLSKDTHVPNGVIVHDSIIVQAIKFDAHKNNNINVPQHITRFFLHHTLVLLSQGVTGAL